MPSLEHSNDFELPHDKLADLRTISLHELHSGSIQEQSKLLQTCITDGFFYLDLTHPSFMPLLSNINNVFDLSKDLFDYPSEIKSLFDTDRISDLKVNGYKPKGRNVVGKGKTDGFESWVIPRNGLFQLSNDPFPYPPAVASHLPDLRYVMQGLNFAAHTILHGLSSALSIPAGQRLEDFQCFNRPSPDILRMLKYHANSTFDVVPQTPHTDLGSLTFVFSTTPGLQVLPSGTQTKDKSYDESDWRYVLPKPGHAIVNIGDCISMMTNGVLKSALHRVGTLPGRAMPERYSLAYLMRPEDQTVLRTLESPLIPRSNTNGVESITSEAWIRKKFTALRGKKDVPIDSQILTGRREILV